MKRGYHPFIDRVFASNPIMVLLILSGFSGVLAISLFVFGFCSLSHGLFWLLLPSGVLWACVSIHGNAAGALTRKGWFAGLCAVSCYDLSRLPFIAAGWEDFIPRIGEDFADNRQVQWVISYLWRYVANGGGLGISYFLLLYLWPVQQVHVSRGILYGLFVFSGLLLTLVLSPNGQDYMFRLNALTFSGSLVGHLIYGAILGLMSKYLMNSCAFKTEDSGPILSDEGTPSEARS